MPVEPCLPTHRTTVSGRELEALRAELRCILQHPAITPERRLGAQAHIHGCTDSTRLGRWLALAVKECADWEEQTLAADGASEI